MCNVLLRDAAVIPVKALKVCLSDKCNSHAYHVRVWHFSAMNTLPSSNLSNSKRNNCFTEFEKLILGKSYK